MKQAYLAPVDLGDLPGRIGPVPFPVCRFQTYTTYAYHQMPSSLPHLNSLRAHPLPDFAWKCQQYTGLLLLSYILGGERGGATLTALRPNTVGSPVLWLCKHVYVISS